MLFTDDGEVFNNIYKILFSKQFCKIGFMSKLMNVIKEISSPEIRFLCGCGL